MIRHAEPNIEASSGKGPARAVRLAQSMHDVVTSIVRVLSYVVGSAEQ